MKIAFIYKYFPAFGGVERVISILANELISQGGEIVIYSFEQRFENPCYPLDNSIKIIPLPDKEIITSITNKNFLVKDLVKKNISILFNHDTTSDSMELCKKVKAEISISLVTLHHGQIYLSWMSLKTIVYSTQKKRVDIRRLFFLLYYYYVNLKRYYHHKKNIQICDAYVTLSEKFRRQLGNSPKNRVIANPLSYSSFFDIEQYVKKENLVIIVGRISDSNKRISMALKIWKELEQNISLKSWRLDIIGEGEDFDLINNLIVKLQLQRVNMVGYVEPESYYKRAKILFMTSAYEGFPLVLMEASQYACVPIVMNSFESLCDMIETGVNGYVVPNNNLYAFKDRAEYLMSNYDTIYQIANAAVINSRKYTPISLIDKWMDLFHDLSIDIK